MTEFNRENVTEAEIREVMSGLSRALLNGRGLVPEPPLSDVLDGIIEISAKNIKNGKDQILSKQDISNIFNEVRATMTLKYLASRRLELLETDMNLSYGNSGNNPEDFWVFAEVLFNVSQNKKISLTEATHSLDCVEEALLKYRDIYFKNNKK